MSTDLTPPGVPGRVRRSSKGRRWRRFKRAVRRHPRRTAGFVALGIVGLLALWCVWSVVMVSRDLAAAEREAGIMRAALVRGDAEGARRALDRFHDATDAAEGRTSGPTWATFEALPLVGDDAGGIATVSAVLANLGREGLTPVLDAAELVTADAFRPVDGQFPLEQIAGLVAPAEASEAAFAQATVDLGEVDSSGFLGPLRSRYESFETLVEDARSTLESTYRAARLMPVLLGGEGARNYLLVLQNNAELRSGGGLPGAVSLIGTDGGRVRIVEQTDMSDLTVSRDPVLKLTREELRVFGENLGWASVNATLTPDIDRASQIVRAHWEGQRATRPDGVFYVDPVAVSYLLRGVGAVNVPGYPAVTADTVVQSVENDVYRVSSDPEVHSDYQQAVAEAVFDAFASGAGDPAETIRGLVRGVLEGRIRMHSFRAAEQAEIDGTEIAGQFNAEATPSPMVGIYINDAGPTKMQYYLHYDADLFARSCEDDVQVLSGGITFRNDGPKDLSLLSPAITGEGLSYQHAEPGHQRLSIYLTSPIGGTITGLEVDDQALDAVVEPYVGRELARMVIDLAPGEQQTVDFAMTGGPGQTADAELRVTPGAFPSSPNGSSPSACTVR